MLRKFVINLERRPDRKQSFLAHNPSPVEFVNAVDARDLTPADLREHGISPDLAFRCPFKGRRVTWGEVACFLSHRSVWERCLGLDEPIMVLEDDAVPLRQVSDDHLIDKLKNCDFLYLQRNENEPEQVRPVDEELELPAYPYNATAYCITPEGARKLLDSVDLARIVPTDEFLPMAIKRGTLVAHAFSDDIYKQISRSTLSSDIELRDDTCVPRDCVVFTVGTDERKCHKLYESAEHYDVPVTNVGVNRKWLGGDMSLPGGGMKVNLLRQALADIDDETIVLFVDAYDVFFASTLRSIVSRFIEMEAEVVFAAEDYCWPDVSLADEFPSVEVGYRYLNSGIFMGTCGELKRILNSAELADDEDDQLFYQRAFLSGNFDIRLDNESYLFQCHDPRATKKGYQLFNPNTRCFSCVYHGNGGSEAKRKLDQLHRAFFHSPVYRAEKAPGATLIHHDDMLVIDLLSSEQCAELIAMAEAHGGWQSMDGDDYPAQEIRLAELDLLGDIELLFRDHLTPIIEQHWRPARMHGVRDAFVTKYTLDTQTSLSLHTDASLVTASVKLNADYTGGVLNFPRQGCSNKEIAVGDCLLFPGQLTHGHESTPITSGTKYSLTIWSRRHAGDKVL